MRSCDIAIIGGGVIGTSIAAHLARGGAKDILLIERASQLGTGTTAKASGGIRHQFSTEANIRCTIESMKEIAHFQELYGVDLHLRQVGYLMLATDHKIAALLKTNTQLQNKLGVPTRILIHNDTQALVPHLNLDGVLAATFCPSDGIADPNSMVEGYAAFARSHGVTFLFDTIIQTVTINRTGTIEFTAGPEKIEAEKVIFATGPYSLNLLQGLGFDPPITPHRKLVFQTTLPNGITDRSPFIIEFPTGWYIKYEAGTAAMGMSLPEDKTVGEETVNLEYAEPVIARGIFRYPPLQQSRLIRGLAGLSDATPDHHAIIGLLPNHPHIYLAIGFSGHGFQHAPITGKILAELVTTGNVRAIDISAFSPERFSRQNLLVDPLVVT